VTRRPAAGRPAAGRPAAGRRAPAAPRRRAAPRGSGGRRPAAPARLLVASFNPGKAKELARMVSELGVEVVDPAACGIRDAWEETGATYEENARGKAAHYATLSGLVTVADDSGLEVEALGGGPGVRSARFGGDGLDDHDRCVLLALRLRGVPPARRGACYVAVAALARPGGEVKLFRGTCEGRIATEMRGTGGFGYDPLFEYPAFGTTFADVPEQRKNGVSHRGAALRALAAFLATAAGRRFAGLRGGSRSRPGTTPTRRKSGR
jgi:XTP/dITP diphosphohydrolase